MQFPTRIGFIFILSYVLLLAAACGENDDLPDTAEHSHDSSGWLVDTTKMTGTKVRDVFPLITQPYYIAASDAPRREMDDKAIVFKIDETVFIFPYWMMWVEVVNGSLNNTHFAVTYCPKTKTTYVFNRNIDGQLHTFRASGILYQDNLVYYDLETGSFWSQMYFKCIHGAHLRQEPELIHSFETSYGTALGLFQDAYVFVGYAGAQSTIQSHEKTSPQSGNMVLGLLDHVLKPGDLSVVNLATLNQKGLINLGTHVVVYDREFQYIDAFGSPSGLTFERTGSFPDILTDNEGNTWDVFGVAISGPRQGQRLKGGISFLAYWWAWEGIYSSFNFLN